MMATKNLDVRYEIIKGDQGRYGEYSNLDKKKDFYSFMLKEYNNITGKNLQWKDDEKESIIDYTKNVFENTIQETVFHLSYNKDVNTAIEFVNTWSKDDILGDKRFLSQKISDIYPSLYKCRNRSAHNTLSYQKDYIRFFEFKSPLLDKCNYFVYFAILILLDTIFIKTYTHLNDFWKSNNI